MPTRLPLSGPWTIAPGDVVLVVTHEGVQRERYARVVRVRRRVVSRRVVAITTADGTRYDVLAGARLCFVCADGHEHVGGVGVEAVKVSGPGHVSVQRGSGR